MDVLLVFLVLFLIVAILAVIITVFIASTIFSGAPWVPTDKKISRAMCDLAELKKGDKVIDLGCGDASILIVAAKEYGAKCIGVELNPLIAAYAKLRCRLAGVSKQVEIVRHNMYTYDLPDVDVVFLYLLEKATQKIEDRLMKRYKHMRVVSHGFRMKQEQKGEKRAGIATVRLYEW